MIKGKYQVVDTLKQNDYKRLEKCTNNQGKIVVAKSYCKSQSKLAQNEVMIYQKLKQPHLYGFPQIKDVFQDNGRFFIIMEQLGQNIQSLRLRCGGRLSLKSALMVSFQILQRLQFLHKHDILHGDIKPSNFLVGKGKLKHKIYLTDFQFSHFFTKSGKHIPQDMKEQFSGTLRFSSRVANSKSNIGRKDQLQSWLYSLIFLINGELPWMHVNSSNIKDANEQVLQLKTKKRAEMLSVLPPVFTTLANYIDQLKFTSAPDYNHIRDLLSSLMKKNGYELDYKYDWQFI